MFNCVKDGVKLKLQEDWEEAEEIKRQKASIIIHGLRQATGTTNVHRVRPVPTTYGTLNIMNIALDENLYPLTLASFAMEIIKQWDVHLGGTIR